MSSVQKHLVRVKVRGHLSHVATPSGRYIKKTEHQKLKRYQGLREDMERLWRVQSSAVPVVIARFCFNAGSFTQLVWKDSEELCVGMAFNGKKAFVVGHYRPGGNINSEEDFRENVLPKGNYS
ncbi:hypothetical protein CRENBAI_011046 [Crenichthys baileyi]|uniref:SCP domain-containing protein n=1 Tax=Crenichthys baileyi TaxID=28760 RepID=A0AAV9RFS2_9TELE